MDEELLHSLNNFVDGDYSEEWEEYKKAEFIERAQDEIQEENKRFVIDSVGKAKWATRLIAKLKSRQDEVKQIAKYETERIKQWEKKETQPLEKDIERLIELLKPYALEEISKLKKKKSTNLSNGAVLKLSKQNNDFKYDDEQLLSFLKDNQLNDYIKETAQWGAFKNSCKVNEVEIEDEDGTVHTELRMISEDGVVVECVKVIPPEEENEFSVDVKGVKL